MFGRVLDPVVVVAGVGVDGHGPGPLQIAKRDEPHLDVLPHYESTAGVTTERKDY